MRERIVRQVTELFGEGQLYCAETTVKILAEAGGKDATEAVRMATGFCSGVARTCGQCGAVSGAIMGIGLYAGRSEPGGEYDACYALVQEFVEGFKTKCGSINCFELVGCDFSTQEGRERFKERRMVRKCIQYVVFAIETALELLRENGYVPEEEALASSWIAPCGLSCGQCVAYDGGPVNAHAKALKRALGNNFGSYAKRFAGMNAVFEKYDHFEELLNFFGRGSCGGCREKGCLFKECQVPACARERDVTYCYQCGEFPCDRHGMPETLAVRWRANNEKMREIGPFAWYCGCSERPRYP